MATRTSTPGGRPARPSGGGSGRPSSRTTSGRPRSGPPRASGGGLPAPPRSVARHDKRRANVVPLPVRAVRGLWMGGAHLVGSLARGLGAGGTLDPAHRRDGLGLTLIALAIVVAAGEWWRLQGPVGHGIHVGVASGIGRLGLLLPLVLVGFGIRLMRSPDRVQATNRVIIGLAAIAVAVTGLLHVAAQVPPPSKAVELQGAGGFVGYAAAWPLASTLTGWVAAPVLVLLGFFGLLVVTATPVHAIPDRVRGALDVILRREPRPGPDEDLDDLETKVVQRRRKPRKGEADDGELAGDEAYEQAMITASTKRPLPKKRPGPPPPPPVEEDDEEPPVARGKRPGPRPSAADAVFDVAAAAAGVTPPPAPVPTPSPVPSRPAPPEPPPTSQPPLRVGAAGAQRRHHLPAADPGRCSLPAGGQGPQRRQRPGGRGAHHGAGPVRHRRPGDRLHPRPDGHPLRGRARPRRSRSSGSPR